jgi:hypothetical protein
MSYAYADLRSSRNHFREPQGLAEKATSAVAPILASLQALWTKQIHSALGGNAAKRSLLRRVLSLGNILILIWIYVVYWGERTVFNNAIEDCDWGHWESWVPTPSFLSTELAILTYSRPQEHNLITSLSSLIPNLSILIPILAVHGPSLHLRYGTPTSIWRECTG